MPRLILTLFLAVVIAFGAPFSNAWAACQNNPDCGDNAPDNCCSPCTAPNTPDKQNWCVNRNNIQIKAEEVNGSDSCTYNFTVTIDYKRCMEPNVQSAPYVTARIKIVGPVQGGDPEDYGTYSRSKSNNGAKYMGPEVQTIQLVTTDTPVRDKMTFKNQDKNGQVTPVDLKNVMQADEEYYAEVDLLTSGNNPQIKGRKRISLGVCGTTTEQPPLPPFDTPWGCFFEAPESVATKFPFTPGYTWKPKYPTCQANEYPGWHEFRRARPAEGCDSYVRMEVMGTSTAFPYWWVGSNLFYFEPTSFWRICDPKCSHTIFDWYGYGEGWVGGQHCRVDLSFHTGSRCDWAQITAFQEVVRICLPPPGASFTSASGKFMGLSSLEAESSETFAENSKFRAMGLPFVINDPVPANDKIEVQFESGKLEDGYTNGTSVVYFPDTIRRIKKIEIYKKVDNSKWIPLKDQVQEGTKITAPITSGGTFRVFATQLRSNYFSTGVPTSPAGQGVSDNDDVSITDVYVYPNPVKKGANPVLRVSLDSAQEMDLSYRIYDPAGQLTLEAKVLSELQIVDGTTAYEEPLDLKSLKSGVYTGIVSGGVPGKEKVSRKFRFTVVK